MELISAMDSSQLLPRCEAAAARVSVVRHSNRGRRRVVDVAMIERPKPDPGIFANPGCSFGGHPVDKRLRR